MSLKAIVLGEANSGKTSICAEFSNGGAGTTRNSPPPQPTIGTSFVALYVDDISDNGAVVNQVPSADNAAAAAAKGRVLNVWDTAGSELYRSIVPLYFRNVEVAVLVFDVTSEPSFLGLDFWYCSFTNFYRNTPRCPPMLVVGNKCDVHANPRQISRYQAEAWIRDHNADADANGRDADHIVAYIETSTRAPTFGIDMVLKTIVEHATHEREAQRSAKRSTTAAAAANRFDIDDLDDDPSRVVVVGDNSRTTKSSSSSSSSSFPNKCGGC